MVATGMRDIADRTHGAAMLLVLTTDPLGLGAASVHSPRQQAAGLFVGAERSFVGAQLYLGFDEPHFADSLFLCFIFMSVPVCDEPTGLDASVVLNVANRFCRTAVHLVGTAHRFWQVAACEFSTGNFTASVVVLAFAFVWAIDLQI